MARSRLTLVLAASCFLTALCEQASSDSSNPSSLFCVTFVEPEVKEIILNVDYSDEPDKVTMELHDDCQRNDTELLTVRMVKQQSRKFKFSISYGECAVTCWDATPATDGDARKITRPSNETVLCKKDVLQPFKSNETDGCCTKIKMNRTTYQQSTTTTTSDLQSTSSTSDSPHTTTETPIPPTPSILPGPAVALLAVLVVEVVVSIILSVVAVMVVRDARNTTITPATTTVRRASSHDLYVCENDLYEPFPGNTAAEQEKKEEEEEEEEKKEKKVLLKLRSITKKRKKRDNDEGKQD